ncbi:TKL/TKL-CCIN protein kinase [Kwoniella heveanensis CBS 569]|nr:TKL/TKL-CCIN protein kinase [Kwoniella heveanensis CBS 569]
MTDPPPPVPPKDLKSPSSAPTLPEQTKRRLSVSMLTRPKSTPGLGGSEPEDQNKEKNKEKEKEKDGGPSKVKEFWSGLTKKSGSSDKLSDAAKEPSKKDPQPTLPYASSTDAGKGMASLPAKAPTPSPVVPRPPTMKPTSTSNHPNQMVKKPRATASESEGNLFYQAVLNAQKKVDRLETTTMVLKALAAGLAIGTAWMPGVGEAVGVVVSMLISAEQITIGRVAALRLVERSATVLEAVEQAIIDHKGFVSPIMQSHINELLGNLKKNNRFLVRMSERSFLKLYLHSDETARQIAAATEDLEDFIKIFQLQAHISTAAWEEQSRIDHEKDMRLLIQKLDQARASDQQMLDALALKSEAQQEAIKTLQRTLDQMLAIQQAEYNSHHPNSPLRILESASYLSIASPIIGPTTLALPDPSMSSHVRALGPLDSLASTSSSSSDTTDIGKPQSRRASMWKGGRLPQQSVWDAIPLTPGEQSPHREFFEKALDVLRRTSNSSQYEIPEWTITSLEISHDEPITHEERIMSGYFSVIWRGKWQGLDVAIKELTPMADRQLFVKEVEVWRRLKSDRILPFYGASSTTGPPPWFLVSPYMRNGNILTYLQTPQGAHCNKLAFIFEMAQGMEYLHSRDIIHGDFKATNVLVDDDAHAIICDFGLSQLKMDFTSKSQELSDEPAPTAGTLRWQSPERLTGGVLTRENDVYAYAMSVYEVLTGTVPFGYIDDNVVRKDIMTFVVSGGVRPSRPKDVETGLWNLITKCWTQDPVQRPTFVEIVEDLSTMYTPPKEPERKNTYITTGALTRFLVLISSLNRSCSLIYYGFAPKIKTHVRISRNRAISPASNTLPLPDAQDDWSSSSGSIASIPPHLESQPSFESDRAERHYRHYLQHNFDDRLSIALWFPTPVPLGSVGYIRHGQFIHLMDAQVPPIGVKSLPPMPYLDEFSSLQTARSPVNARGTTDKGLDMVAALTNFIKPSGERSQKAISRRLSLPLRPGMKQAALIVEDGQFEIYKSLAECRSYLTCNIDWILDNFGDQHQISKEDVIIVVGTLSARCYAMVVSNFAPRTALTFNVHAASYRVNGEPWGTWTVNKQSEVDRSRAFKSALGLQTAPSQPAPETPAPASTSMRRNTAELDEQEFKYTCKVSKVSTSHADCVLLAKLKFPPGGSDPTLYP